MHVSLRSWKKEDRLILAELANNIKIWNNVRDRLPHPYKLKHADLFIAYCEQLTPPSVMAIEANGKIAGCIGLELQDDISRISAELGYWIGEPYWGKGIATEAVKQMLQYIPAKFPLLIRIYAKVFDRNLPSMSVLKKSGFHVEGIQEKSIIKAGIVMDEHIWVKFI